MALKDAEIKVRLTKEQKELIKRVAKEEGMSMSEFIVVTTEKMARKKEGNFKSQKMIEDRAIRTDKKLLEIAEQIRGNNNKKNSPKKKRFMFWVGKL
ncbi:MULTISPECIES: DUF1778 domain-containing protein [Clostridium]|nr:MULTISPECIES: DUF1778 domain-containing protein [Clostridium]